jgi:hypothetical protein
MLRESFHKVNEQSVALGSELQRTFLDASQPFNEDLEAHWSEFRSRYPGRALFTVSRIGFNSHRNFGLVVVGMAVGSLAGHGALYLVEKVGETWEIRGQAGLWVS